MTLREDPRADGDARADDRATRVSSGALPSRFMRAAALSRG